MLFPFASVLAIAWTLTPAIAHPWATQSDPSGIVLLDNVGVGCESQTDYAFAYGDASDQPRYSQVIEHPDAEFIVVHFSSFNLPAQDYVVLRAVDQENNELATVKYTGEDKQGDFFSKALYAQSIVLELYASGDTEPTTYGCVGFHVDSYRFLAQPGRYAGPALEDACGSDGTQEAACFPAFPAIRQTMDSVARLLIHKNNGSFFCTGWLLGCEGHLLTNYHCIASQLQAGNTEYEFRGQGQKCGSKCDRPLRCRGDVRSLSAKLVAASQELDYALVKFDENLSTDYGYLRLRQTGAEVGERIYIPQHPMGWGKRVAMKVADDFGRVESISNVGCSVDQVAYSLDTQGGSSGSPVISWDDNSVVGLHHCGGCPLNAAINANKLIKDMQALNVLPQCAVATPTSPVS